MILIANELHLQLKRWILLSGSRLFLAQLLEHTVRWAYDQFLDNWRKAGLCKLVTGEAGKNK